ncbi:hypothetical protein B0H14DRAFT_3539822 [Mycena olivaceomarginata]|nr:hypothetical protein B0H14DRAFT_3539822 [Mycena olivaceomarginata]
MSSAVIAFAQDAGAAEGIAPAGDTPPVLEAVSIHTASVIGGLLPPPSPPHNEILDQDTAGMDVDKELDLDPLAGPTEEELTEILGDPEANEEDDTGEHSHKFCTGFLWSRECGFSSFKLFADSKPNPATLRNIASRIVNNYATPKAEFDFSESSKDPAADDESLDSETDGKEESPSPSHSSPAPDENPNDDVAYHNTRLLTRDLLMIVVLVCAISDGDIGRVEALLPHFAMMFRGAGCNKYCSEILHFIHNLKHVWTPKFANIMRDNAIIRISGGGPGHCMSVDMNIEHLIGYLKTLLQAKGLNSTWDRLGDMSAAIIHLQRVKKIIAAALNSPHHSNNHTTPEIAHLQFTPTRSNNPPGKLTKDIQKVGEAKLKSSTLATFNKKIIAMIEGHGFEEEDECPAIAFGSSEPPEEEL